MTQSTVHVGGRYFLPKPAMAELVRGLKEAGYTVIAPVQVDGAILLRPIETAEQIAHGIQNELGPGRYRLTPGEEPMMFDYVVGPDSAKRYLFPPQQALFSLTVKGERFAVEVTEPEAPRYAFLGLRPCDLAAIRIQDRVFGVGSGEQPFRCETERFYPKAREQALIVAVNCTRPAATCFCESMGTGPAADCGFDLALTELREGFVAQVGTDRGRSVLEPLPVRPPSAAELELVELKIQHARGQMQRRLNPLAARQALQQAVEHPRWDVVARRCLSCGNCTMVCPTCFCSTVSDENDLASDTVTRTRRWESCFTEQFSYTTAGPVRQSVRGRYRHWLRHKLYTWWKQFGTSGCVGCGRCITWCPVGIDLTEEVAAIASRSGDAPVAQPVESEVQR